MNVKEKKVTYRIDYNADVKIHNWSEKTIKQNKTLVFKDVSKFNSKIELLKQTGEWFSAQVTTIEYLEV